MFSGLLAAGLNARSVMIATPKWPEPSAIHPFKNPSLLPAELPVVLLDGLDPARFRGESDSDGNSQKAHASQHQGDRRMLLPGVESVPTTMAALRSTAAATRDTVDRVS